MKIRLIDIVFIFAGTVSFFGLLLGMYRILLTTGGM